MSTPGLRDVASHVRIHARDLSWVAATLLESRHSPADGRLDPPVAELAHVLVQLSTLGCLLADRIEAPAASTVWQEQALEWCAQAELAITLADDALTGGT